MYLYGASGHAKVIIDILKASGESIDGLIDDDLSLSNLLGIPVLHGETSLSPVIVSIGDNAARQRVVGKLTGMFGKAIHPSAIISSMVEIGEGTVVMQGAIIQSGTQVGKHCIVNTGASVDHECMLGDYVHISPHATLCGNVRVGEGSWIGAGATVIPGVNIGSWSVVGAGAVVTRDLPDNVIVVGNKCVIINATSKNM